MGLDVGRVRARYPALADGYAYLDGAAGTQLPDSVIDAMAGAWRAGIPQLPPGRDLGDGDPWLALLQASGRSPDWPGGPGRR